MYYSYYKLKSPNVLILTMKNKTVLNAELNQIRRLLDENSTTKRIQEELGLQPKTLQRHLNKIYTIDKALWQERAKESLESRALKIMRSLEQAIEVNTEIATNKEEDPRDRIEASVKVVEANIIAYNLLESGPKPTGMVKMLPN